jgi:hypothetical protein
MRSSLDLTIASVNFGQKKPVKTGFFCLTVTGFSGHCRRIADQRFLAAVLAVFTAVLVTAAMLASAMSVACFTAF